MPLYFGDYILNDNMELAEPVFEESGSGWSLDKFKAKVKAKEISARIDDVDKNYKEIADKAKQDAQEANEEAEKAKQEAQEANAKVIELQAKFNEIHQDMINQLAALNAQLSQMSDQSITNSEISASVQNSSENNQNPIQSTTQEKPEVEDPDNLTIVGTGI